MSASQVFTLDDLADLQDDLFPVRHEWYNIGLRIGLNLSDLNPIKAQYSGVNFKDSLRDMLILRLTKARPLSREDIISALRRPSVGADGLAADLEKKYTPRLSEPQAMEVTEEGMPTSPLDDSVFPDQPRRTSATAPAQSEGVQPLLILFSEDNLPELANELVSACDKWFLIGGHLKVRDSILRGIRSDFRDPIQCLYEAIRRWIIRAEPSTCEELLAALMKANVNKKLLARALSEKYNCPLPVRPYVSAPSAADVKYAKRKCEALREDFTNLVRDMKRELKRNRRLTVEDFLDKFFLQLSSSMEHEHRKFFDRNNLSKCTKFKEIFYYFNKYWNYLNYNLLGHIITIFGDSDLKTRMDEFHRDVKKFRKSTTLKVFRKIERCKGFYVAKKFAVIITKHGFNADTTLHKVEKIRLSAIKHYQLSDFALNIAQVLIGSTFILWLVPKSFVNDLMFGLTAELMEELSIEEVALYSTSPTHITSEKKLTEANQKLIKACKKGDEGRVRALLERGADIQAREDNEFQWTPLMCATLNNHLGTVQLLLSHPLSDLMIDVQDTKGWTAFVLACYRGNLEMVRLLEEHGANIDHQNHEGWNGLMWAASKKGNLAVAKHLLASGANTDLRDYLDWTPLMIASQTLSDKNIVQELLMHDADPNTRNKDGVTPLHIATNKDRDDIIEELLRSETVEVDAQDEKNDSTPLMIASQKGNNTIVKILLNNKAKPNIKAEKARGWTALFMAANKRRTDVVKTLLKNGADATIKDKDGATVVDYAAKPWFSTDTYKVLLTATGLTAQEHKKQLQAKNFGSRLDSALRMIDAWYRQVEDVLLYDKAAKRKAQEASQHETEAPAAAALAVH